VKISKQKLTLASANKGWNFKALAEHSGVSRATISLILSGKICRIETALKLANVLDVDIEGILET
jgi:transcriptional regulator with XRE-family HTH domain